MYTFLKQFEFSDDEEVTGKIIQNSPFNSPPEHGSFINYQGLKSIVSQGN